MIVATYNILHGYYSDQILANIKLLTEKGANIICLQEASPSFKPLLNILLKTSAFKDWGIEYAHSGIAGNLAILWDSSRLRLQRFETIQLPTIQPVLMQRIKGHGDILQRLALVGNFSANGKTIRMSNVHLAWEGGIKHRLAQLKYLKEKLHQSSADADIIAGDFNTFAPSLLRRFQENKVERVLGADYINAFPNLEYSCDISYTAPQDKWETIAKICRLFGIKLRSRLDYIFARNMHAASATMLDLPGSDHRPLITSFDQFVGIEKSFVALHWIIDLLQKHNIAYQIGGGFAAKLYGSPRSLNDIDIDIPDEDFQFILPEVAPYIIYGPIRHKDGKWDCYLMTLNYKGQEIDISGGDTLKMSNKQRTEWISLKTPPRSMKIKVDGLELNIMYPQDLIDYKKELDGDHQQIDVQAAEEYLARHALS